MEVSVIEEQDPQPKPRDVSFLTPFLKELDEQSSSEEKLHLAIRFMREALAQEGTPNFKVFWEIRRLCLPLFKDATGSPVRLTLWEEYIELTREGRRLKNLLDEETAFAVEQIEIAITALEAGVKGYHEALEDVISKTPEIVFLMEPKSVEKRIPFYKGLQRRLNFLNIYAEQIHGLRKELIKTEMRIRQKNQFFERLSKLGDLVFPVRKELIKEISDAFIADVKHFAVAHFEGESFNPDNIRRGVFFFREEIKGMQAMAKVLTLNTHAFSSSREELSSCWDKLKGMEKELKKEYTEQRQKSGENAALVREKIVALSASIQSEEISADDASLAFDEITRQMREVELTYDDVRALKDEIRTAKLPLEEKKDKEAALKKEKELEYEKKRSEALDRFREKVASLRAQLSSPEAETLIAECRKELSTIAMTKLQKQALEKELKSIREAFEEQKEKALLELSDDDKATLDTLNDVLEQRKLRKKEIKAHLEEMRKTLGGSSLDFEKAIEMGELMDQEKQRYEKIEEGIREIEQKIREIKRKS